MVLNVILSLSFRHYLRPDADCCPKSTKSNTRWPKLTDSRPRNYVSFQFVEFVLKIAIKREQNHARMSSAERERFR